MHKTFHVRTGNPFHGLRRHGFRSFLCDRQSGLTTNSKTPLQTELTLEKNIPPHLLPVAHHWLILHGRYVCTARAPKCGECGIAVWCRKYAADHKAPKG